MWNNSNVRNSTPAMPFLPIKEMKAEDKRKLDSAHAAQQASVKAIDLCRQIEEDEEVNVALPSEQKQDSTKAWIMDSGAGDDLIDRAHADPEFIETSKKPITFCTANGPVTIDKECHSQCVGLGINIIAKILGNTPLAPSLGKRCMKDGFTFVWNRFQLPFLIKPNKKVVYLPVRNLVPYFIDDGVNNDESLITADVCTFNPSLSNSKISAVPALDAPPLPPPSDEPIPEDGQDGSVERGKGNKNKSMHFLKSEDYAKTIEHQMTHEPKNPFCRICQIAKAMRVPARATQNTPEHPQPEREASVFGEFITIDYLINVARKNDIQYDGLNDALICLDRATSCVHAYPTKTKSFEETLRCINHFTGGKPIQISILTTHQNLSKLGNMLRLRTHFRPQGDLNPMELSKDNLG
jgi:hypothetical protein